MRNIKRINIQKAHRAVILFLALSFPVATLASEITFPQQERLVHLLKHDCGSCHGLTLKGGLGPSLLPERLASLPRELVVNTIMYGRSGTPMPPWRTMLTPEEIEWLVDYLYTGEAIE
jgi:cytochrome c55X